MVGFDDFWIRVFVFVEPTLCPGLYHVLWFFVCKARPLNTATSNILSSRLEHVCFSAFIVTEPTLFAVKVRKIGKFVVPLLKTSNQRRKHMNELNINMLWNNAALKLTKVAIRVAGWNPGVLPAAIWFLNLLCSSRIRFFSSCVISGIPVQFAFGVWSGERVADNFRLKKSSQIEFLAAIQLTVSSGHATWSSHKRQ